MKKFTILFIVAVAANLIMGSDAYAQITQRGTSTSANTTNTTLTINKPTGLAVGDVMIAVITQGENDVAGLIANDASGTGWGLVAGGSLGSNGNDDWRGTVLYKVADAGDVAAANFAFTLDASVNGDASVGGIIAFYNVNTTGGVLPDGTGTGPFDVAAGTFQSQTSSTITAPGITTVTNGAAVLMLAMVGDNNAVGSWSTTAPGTLNEILEAQFDSGIDETSAAAFATLGTAGATGNGTATMGNSDRNGGVLVALKPLFVSAGPDHLVNSGSVSLVGSTNIGSPVYAWTQVGGPAGPTITTPANSSTTVTGLASGNLYTFRLTVNGIMSDDVQVRMLTGSNLWATSSSGQQISSFATNGAAAIAGPVNMFAPSFTGANNTYTRTAALGRTQSPSQTAGYFYYLGTSDNGNENNGEVEVWAGSATGNGLVRIGSLDLNGGGSGTELGFVRLGMGPNGTGWILAGDGSNLYLAKFTPNGTNPVTITIEDASVTLSGGTVSSFVNGDICLDGNGRLVALANNGSGVTQIFVGDAAGSATTLTKKWDLVDGNSDPFTGSVNGVAFEKSTGNSGLYISTSDGLYYINSTQANIPSGTIPCTQVWAGTGLQDLASNFFPNTIITPVSMTSFSVNKQGVSAILNWTTVTEINTDHFEIERSMDGINFSTVGSKAAAGNSTDVINYQHTDAIGSLSGVIYYRIKTVDMDGKVSYSKIVSLRLNGAVKAFNVYPNPFVSDLKVVLDAASDAAVTVRISNAAGQTVFSRATFVQKGNNVIVIASELSALQKGMYFVEVISEDGKQTQKIIKR